MGAQSLLSQGAGSSLNTKSAAEATARSGDIGVNLSGIGSFNPPVFSQLASNQIIPIAVAVVAAVGLLLWRR